MSNYSNQKKPQNIILVLRGFVREDNATDVDLDEDFDQDFDKESNTDMQKALAHVANMVTENNTEINSQIARTGVNMNAGDPDYLGPFTTMKAAVDHCKTFAREHCLEVVRGGPRNLVEQRQDSLHYMYS
ncbi:unnamed protein product [Rhizopus stolonifer]